MIIFCGVVIIIIILIFVIGYIIHRGLWEKARGRE